MKTIEEAKKEYELNVEIFKTNEMLTKKFNDMDIPLSVYGGWGNRKITIGIDLTSQPLEGINKQLLRVATVLEPTVMTHKIPHSKSYTHVSPYLLRTSSEYKGGVSVTLSWDCKFYVRITLPCGFYKDVIEFGTRGVTSSEREVYFGPSDTHRAISNIRIRTVKFTEFESVSWYGGSTTCFTEDPQNRNSYERMVFTGSIAK